MNDVIVYSVMNFGVDGRGKPSVSIVTLDSEEAEQYLKKQGNYKSCYIVKKSVEDLEEIKNKALEKLTKLDKLSLGL